MRGLRLHKVHPLQTSSGSDVQAFEAGDAHEDVVESTDQHFNSVPRQILMYGISRLQLVFSGNSIDHF